MTQDLEEEGVHIGLSAAQLAAVLEEGSLDAPSTFTNRLFGGFLRGFCRD
jgi:hypothetical protein